MPENNVISLIGRMKKQKPDSVSVAFDFGAWGVVFWRKGRFAFRQAIGTMDAANAEAERLIREEGYRPRARPWPTIIRDRTYRLDEVEREHLYPEEDYPDGAA